MEDVSPKGRCSTKVISVFDLGVEGAMLIHNLVENALQITKERHVRACELTY